MIGVAERLGHHDTARSCYQAEKRKSALVLPYAYRSRPELTKRVHKIAGYQLSESHPLLYDFTFSQEDECSAEFFLADFDFAREQDCVVAAEMLNRCYETQHHSPAEVAEWCELPVFDESLWLWVKSRASKEALGLGISTYQACIRECYLDWIQVLPEYQGRGLGRLLVSETIKRAIGKSDIIRVTGMVDDFYRRCGFVGNESWHTLRRL